MELYVVERSLIGFPHLTVWQLKEERSTCYIVWLRGNNKVLKKNTIGRSYFTSKVELVSYLRVTAQIAHDYAHRQMVRMNYLLMQGDDVVIDFARNKEDAVDTIEKLVQARCKGDTG